MSPANWRNVHRGHREDSNRLPGTLHLAVPVEPGREIPACGAAGPVDLTPDAGAATCVVCMAWALAHGRA